jgi:hypothetical protein
MDFRLEISLQDSNSDLMTSPRYRFRYFHSIPISPVEVEYIAENQIVQEIIRSSLDSIQEQDANITFVPQFHLHGFQAGNKPPRFQFGLDDQSEVSI